ncbi:MAG: 3-isopropylmalate dehydratase small subunit [Pseudomonadota bacterium]
MKPITTISGHAVPLDRANVDTDQIIPKQYLKSIRRTGFGDYLFDGWRFEDEGELGMTPNERQLNRGFVLNQAAYQGAKVLLARENFGCGSSREHAVWALKEYGFDCVIAPSFADIFYNNCFKNGVLAVVLPAATVDALFSRVMGDASLLLEVDVAAQTVAAGGEVAGTFEIEAARREKLLRGLDDIELTLQQGEAIRAFEARHHARAPWLFGEPEGSA